MTWKPIYAIQDGIKIKFDSASVHPFSAGISYGATIFECIRAYKANDGSLNIFRLDAHLDRLIEGMKFMRFENPPLVESLWQGIIDSVRVNDPKDDAYIRIHVHVGDIGPMATSTGISWVCGATPRARSVGYYNGLALQVSSWVKPHDTSAPPRIKAAANYHMARIALLQAKADGYDNALLLTKDGKLSEGTGASVFLIKKGILITPSISSDILESITRDTVITLAKELCLEIQQRVIDRTEIYNADEIFICGTGPEIEPVINVDRHTIGTGKPGKITQMIQNSYENAVRGFSHKNWLIQI